MQLSIDWISVRAAQRLLNHSPEARMPRPSSNQQPVGPSSRVYILIYMQAPPESALFFFSNWKTWVLGSVVCQEEQVGHVGILYIGQLQSFLCPRFCTMLAIQLSSHVACFWQVAFLAWLAPSACRLRAGAKNRYCFARGTFHLFYAASNWTFPVPLMLL